MKILFIQLPLIDHSLTYIQGNIEYAPACIGAYLKFRLNTEHSLEFLPFVISNFASNAFLVDCIAKINPDIICFSNYLWNVERHLRIAKVVKSFLPQTKIFFGGPEIANGSYALSEYHPEIDCFIVGEGEWFFNNFFSHKTEDAISLINNNPIAIQPPNALVPITELVEPFTADYLDPMPDGSIFIEMTRGCPYRCDYCYYSKSSITVREHPIEVLLKALTSEKNVREIYILSPTFNRATNFHELLKTIRAHNHGIHLHTEMRADGIDATTARLIRDAGFRSLEIGLQTLTNDALVQINRHSKPHKEIDGMKYLRDEGIELKIGVIPGLPGDTPSRFMKTVEILVREGFRDNIELYPLMILPGTRMRDIARNREARFLQKPPYYFLEGWGFAESDIVEIGKLTEVQTGYTSRIDFLPDFSLPEEGFLIAGILIDCKKTPHWHKEEIFSFIQTCVFTIMLKSDEEFDVLKLTSFFSKLPLIDQLYVIVFITNRLIEEQLIADYIFHTLPNSFFTRMNHFHNTIEKSPFRFFQVFDQYSAYKKAKKSYSIIAPIIKINSNTISFTHEVNHFEDYLLIDSHSYRDLRHWLLEEFCDDPECVAFELKEDKEDFYRSLKKEFYHIEGLCIKSL
ncbi:MAG: radical SAM protein [Spirochaetes bacterium]|nr:radical SAM protein [Spirochaetota bacterium]